MVIGGKKGIGHLALCKEGFSAARCAQHDPVGAFEGFPVCQDDVLRLRIDTVVKAARLEHLTGAERQKDCRPAGGKAALDLHLVHTQGQGRYKTLFLLIVQPDQVAVVGVGDAVHRIDDVFQLLFGWRGMHQKDCDHKHLFIVVLQILQ